MRPRSISAIGDTLSRDDTPKSSIRCPIEAGRAGPQAREDLGHDRRLAQRQVLAAVPVVDDPGVGIVGLQLGGAVVVQERPLGRRRRAQQRQKLVAAARSIQLSAAQVQRPQRAQRRRPRDVRVQQLAVVLQRRLLVLGRSRRKGPPAPRAPAAARGSAPRPARRRRLRPWGPWAPAAPRAAATEWRAAHGQPAGRRAAAARPGRGPVARRGRSRAAAGPPARTAPPGPLRRAGSRPATGPAARPPRRRSPVRPAARRRRAGARRAPADP